MIVSELSRRYARALYSLAKENKTNDKVFGELRSLSSALDESKEVRDFVFNPMVRPDQKAAALKASFAKLAFSPEVQSFLLTLAENQRLENIQEMIYAYGLISDEDHGVQRGTVRSASPLAQESRTKIEDIVTQVTRKKVILSFVEDAKLIGGTVAQVGGWTFDDSLESHLRRLNEDLNRRMS
jgi:F-type H+-transporting ATPase subunit delta